MRIQNTLQNIADKSQLGLKYFAHRYLLFEINNVVLYLFSENYILITIGYVSLQEYLYGIKHIKFFFLHILIKNK